MPAKLLKTAIISTAFASSAIAQSTMQTDGYSTTYGSDNALIKHKSGCFASAVFRSNQCINGVNPINKFAVEYKGKIYCSIRYTPVIDKPLLDAYDRNSSIVSICTMKGWVHQKKRWLKHIIDLNNSKSSTTACNNYIFKQSMPH